MMKAPESKSLITHLWLQQQKQDPFSMNMNYTNADDGSERHE